MKDASATIGTKLDAPQGRDAIHIAVLSTVAAVKLKRGEDVGFKDGMATNHNVEPVGIVDPFLKEKTVKAGEIFWLVLYPRSVTSLRHVWEHPDIPSEIEPPAPTSDTDEIRRRNESRAWIDEYASELGFSGEAMIRAAQRYLERGDYLVGGDDMEGRWTSDAFWDHFRIVTGEAVGMRNPGNFFSCSC